MCRIFYDVICIEISLRVLFLYKEFVKDVVIVRKLKVMLFLCVVGRQVHGGS